MTTEINTINRVSEFTLCLNLEDMIYFHYHKQSGGNVSSLGNQIGAVINGTIVV